MELQPPFTIPISEDDHEFFERIWHTARKPIWRHVLDDAPLLILYLIAFALIWVPGPLFEARGIALCRRYGTFWLPIDGLLPKLLYAPGVLLLCCAVLLTSFCVLQVVQARRLYKILSRSISLSKVASSEAS